MIAEIVALARQLGDRSREVHEGKWRKVAAGCHEVRGKTLGIVGYGHIGRQVGVLAEAMGMRVLFYDIVAKLPMGNNRAVGVARASCSQQATSSRCTCPRRRETEEHDRRAPSSRG